ncbi:MAG: NAD(P)-dependent oxidoreductase [Rhodobacterales bacterium]|uniref:NAD-dependent epimerase/dehydratase family protein n=1 Tax=Hyphomonas sp. TaxID=87 RepID=UPI0019A83A2C|nr:NAD(P)-dependent oxidoreductase [Rhodobacterales bacterium]
MTATIVTGATGFLGGAVTRRLLAAGEPVIAVGRNRKKLADLAKLGATPLELDLVHGEIPQTLPSASHLVHCAALSSPWGARCAFEAANVHGTQRAMDLARAAGVGRFVHISSPSVYFRFADQEEIPEDTILPPPVNAYAATKAASETLVLAEPSLDPVILRPRGLYGPGDTALLPRLLRAARQRPLPLMRGGNAATDLTYIDDVVNAVLAAMDALSPAARVFNISGGQALSIRSVAEQAAAKAGIEVRWRSLPWSAVQAVTRLNEALHAALPGRPEPAVTAYSAGLFAFRQTLDISRACDQLGWQPRITFEDGLERTFAEQDA